MTTDDKIEKVTIARAMIENCFYEIDKTLNLKECNCYEDCAYSEAEEISDSISATLDAFDCWLRELRRVREYESEAV